MKRILVVDDEIHTVRLLQEYLKSGDYEVYTATDGLEAVQKFKDLRPHIVLLDILMPGMSGIDVLKKIKEMEPESVVIMITAILDDKMSERAFQLGADSYMTKPLDLKYIERYLTDKMNPPQYEGKEK